MSSKDRIREKFLASKCRREKVQLPLIGEDVYVRQRTTREKSEFDKETLELQEQGIDIQATLRTRLFIWVYEDEDGKPIFDGDDAISIDSAPDYLTAPVIDRYRELNGGDESAAIVTAEKKEATAGGDSSAVSP